MPYKVRLLRPRIIRELRALELNPYEPRAGADIARLRGTKGREDVFRLRVGDYRVIYAVVAGIVYITDIFHRGKGYKQIPSRLQATAQTSVRS
jgi:mRNA interferase RelE/StbE